MNLQTARQELSSRSPKTTATAIAVEAVVVVGVSFLLVGIFA